MLVSPDQVENIVAADRREKCPDFDAQWWRFLVGRNLSVMEELHMTSGVLRTQGVRGSDVRDP
jgi:hypothetical protein